VWIMPRNFSFPGQLKLGGAVVRDPRIVMRVIIGLLLVGNIVAAAIAFKPFGGSVEDLRNEQQRLARQLADMRNRAVISQKLVDKVRTAQKQGDQFISQYFMDVSTASSSVVVELNQTATEAGIKMGQVQFDRQPIEGSDSLIKETLTIGFDGTYANLTKFMHQVDKSPRFLIIESMQAAAPQAQGGQSLNVTLKILAFINDPAGDAL
jgi:Tfp pilus assembly protein PilO